MLPVRTPGQLLAEINQDAKLPPLTGTVVETTSLGLPQLPQAGNPTSLSSLLTGSHTIKVYYQDAQPLPAGGAAADERDRRHQVREHAVALGEHRQLGHRVHRAYDSAKARAEAQAARRRRCSPPSRPPTRYSRQVGKTTLVSVQDNVLVAGEPAYQLVLAPKDHRSLIGRVVIAVDAKYGMPLRVQVFAKGDSGPAFQVGYTALSMNTAPAAANFELHPAARRVSGQGRTWATRPRRSRPRVRRRP